MNDKLDSEIGALFRKLDALKAREKAGEKHLAAAIMQVLYDLRDKCRARTSEVRA